MNRTLLSLAIIKVNWVANKHDYIQNYVLLVGSILKRKDYNNFELPTLQSDILSEYGLKIPQFPLVTILKRMSKNKYVEKSYDKYIVQKEKLLELDFQKDADKITKSYETLINNIINYCENEFNLSIDHNDIEEAFLAFLSDHDLDILCATTNQSTLPEYNKSRKLKYIVSKFILNAYENDKDVFSIISDISIGYSLAQSILYSELNSYSGKLTKLNFYFDTPFILNLLGLNGEYKKKSSEELIHILNEENANLYVLRTNLDEIEAILNDCFKQLDKGDFKLESASKVLRFCYQNEVTSTDIQQFVLRLKETLEAYNIFYDKVPSYNERKEFQIDDELLTETIFETYKVFTPDLDPKDFEMKGTIRRDVKVLSGMYKLRKGGKPRKIKDANHIFITTNGALAFASRKFELKSSNDHYTIPVCLTDVFVGTLIWLQSPVKVEQINQKKLIADCYASLQPNDLLVKKFSHEVEKSRKMKRISSDDYYLIRSDRATITLLGQYTFNDPDLFDDSTTEEILNRIINKIKEEEVYKLDKEKLAHEETKLKYDKVIFVNEKLMEEKLILPNKISRLLGNLVFYALILTFSLSVILSFLSAYLNLSTITIVLLWIIVFIFTFLNLHSGFSFKKSREKTTKYIYDRLLKLSVK